VVFPFSIINIAHLAAGYKQKMKKTALHKLDEAVPKSRLDKWITFL
jgi:hypothetical protein